MTLESGEPLRLSSSPIVLTSRRFGEDATPAAPSSLPKGSETLVTCLLVSRSYQSLPTMPLMAGVAPDIMVECPTAVTEG